MYLSTLVLLVPFATIFLPSTSAIECTVGTLIPNAAGRIEIGGENIVMSFPCPTEATGCITAYTRQGFNTETSRIVLLSCQVDHLDQACASQATVIAPDHWYDIRCCTGNNCNRDGLNNIDWSDRTPNINTAGGIPTFPSFPTFSIPTDQPIDIIIPTNGPTNSPFTPTQAAAATQAPTTTQTPVTTQAPAATQSPTQSPTASPITGSTGPTTRPTIPIATSTGINNVAFTRAIFSPLVIFILALVSFIISF